MFFFSSYDSPNLGHQHADPICQDTADHHWAGGQGVDREGPVDQGVLLILEATYREMHDKDIKGKFISFSFIVICILIKHVKVLGSVKQLHFFS